MTRILIILIPIAFFSCQMNKPIEISKKEFEKKILIPGDLERYYIYANNFFSEPEIRFFIKPDSLHLPRHENVKNIKERYQYFFKIDKNEPFERFDKYLLRRSKELDFPQIDMRPFKIME